MMKERQRNRIKYSRFFTQREYSVSSLSELSDSIKMNAERKWFDEHLVHELKNVGLTDQEIIRLFYF
ncbi:MAG: hypothetical protein JXD21_08995 [Candidatus Omnitrophica bacterium]|nr:hypothetical protein [Candidatus Omnitrophota bacterium]